MGDLVIGVDGGGTKTVAWLAPLNDPRNNVVLGRGKAGPGNPRSAGFETAQANIAAAIEAAFRDAQLTPCPAVSACFGLAGAGREGEQSQITRWAKVNNIARIVDVCGDAKLVLAAASPTYRGIALICGTGSLAWGRNAAGKTARSGGWGYLIGDEGSGYYIAIEGLRAAVSAADGRGEPTLLHDGMLAALGRSATDELVEAIYGPAMSRDRLADLSKVVFAAAETDAVARRIIERAAHALAEAVAALDRRLDLQDSSEKILALAGNVLLNQPRLRTRLHNRLSELERLPNSTILVEEPVRGAVALARIAVR